MGDQANSGTDRYLIKRTGGWSKYNEIELKFYLQFYLPCKACNHNLLLVCF